MTEAFDPDEFVSHDGNVVDRQAGRLAGDHRQLRLTIGLLASDEPRAVRRRCGRVGNGLSPLPVHGDVAPIIERAAISSAGNIDLAPMDDGAATEISAGPPFGAMIEAEASNFEFTEIHS